MKSSPTMQASNGPSRTETTRAKPTRPVETPTMKSRAKTMIPTEKENVTQSLKTTHYSSTNKVIVTSPDKVEKSSTKPTAKSNESNWENNGLLNSKGNKNARSGSRSSAVSGVGIGLIVLSLVVIMVALCWLVYAYQHPQSKSGRFLIEVKTKI